MEDKITMDEENFKIKNFRYDINRRLLLLVFVVFSIGILISGVLCYIFSESVYTIFFSIIIGVTLSIIVNYIVLVSRKIITNVDIEITCKSDEGQDELKTVMKME